MDFNFIIMKKLLFITTLLLTTVTYSQYNLEFSKVLNFNIGGDINFVTVPEGKVWKIESGANNVAFKLTSTNQPYGNNLTLSNHSTMHFDDTGNAAWLGPGTQIHQQSSAQNWLSILEFSLVEIGSSFGGDTGGIDSTGSSSSSIGNSFANNAGIPGEDFTDLDGNTYGTTNINGMIWTTSNYQGSTYSDGTPIPYISDFNEWKNATTGGYTYWVQDASLGYGKLYNLHALRGRHDDDDSTPNKKFAPDGWHLPDYSEIDYVSKLYSNLGNVNASALKSTTLWFAGTNGTNISGLDVKPYPAINAAFWNDENFGFTSASGFNTGSYIQYNVGGSTHFGSSSASSADPYRRNDCLHVYLSGNSTSAFSSYTPYLTGISGNSDQNDNFNEGVYVRLIKDY